MRSARTSRILALPWSVSVTIPACEPVNDTAGTPERLDRHAEQRHRDALAGSEEHVHLPAAGRVGDVVRQANQVVGGLAHGRNDDHDIVPARRVRTTWSATARIRSGSATDVPPYFWTTRSRRTTVPAGIRAAGRDSGPAPLPSPPRDEAPTSEPDRKSARGQAREARESAVKRQRRKTRRDSLRDRRGRRDRRNRS